MHESDHSKLFPGVSSNKFNVVNKDTRMKKRAGWDRGRSHGHLPSGQFCIIGFVGRVVLLREDTDG